MGYKLPSFCTSALPAKRENVTLEGVSAFVLTLASRTWGCSFLIMGYETKSCQFQYKRDRVALTPGNRATCHMLSYYHLYSSFYHFLPFSLLFWHNRQDNLGRVSFITSNYLLRLVFKMDGVLLTNIVMTNICIWHLEKTNQHLDLILHRKPSAQVRSSNMDLQLRASKQVSTERAPTCHAGKPIFVIDQGPSSWGQYT